MANAVSCKKYDDGLRALALMAYGNLCACCGENNALFLTIDHTFNNGAEHRKVLGGQHSNGHAIYRWLKKHNYPEGFQILCWNCQHGKRIHGGCQTSFHREQ